MRSQTFNAFWHGAALSPLHWACLSSFIERGHRLRLFSYRDLDVPKGVILEDARKIMSDKELFEFENSFSAFSNIFRYKVLLEQGGWWVDTDVLCLKEDIPDCTYAWARQDEDSINGAVLRFPAGDPTLRKIHDAALKIGKRVKVWGQIGPTLLTKFLAGRQFPGHYGTTHEFYPVHWLEPHLFWMRDGNDVVVHKCGNAPFLHLWGSMFSYYGIDIAASPPRGSFLQHIYERSSFPHALPPSDEEKTLVSISAFLGKKWVRERSKRLLGHDLFEGVAVNGR
jgi:hypothetical protein